AEGARNLHDSDGFADDARPFELLEGALQQPVRDFAVESADDHADRATGAVRGARDHAVAVRDRELSGRVARRPQARELVFLGGRLVRRRRVLADDGLGAIRCDLLVLRRRFSLNGLGFGPGPGRGLRFELFLPGRAEPVLAGPAVLVHSARSGSSKRRSWWCSLCASLSRLASR